MSLEARLRAAAADAFPPTPDLATAWSTNVGPQPTNVDQPRRWRPLALALAALLVPAAAIGAVELLRTDHIRIERLETPPSLPGPATPAFGDPVATIGEASKRAGFPVQTIGEPNSIHVSGDIVTLTYDEVSITQVPALQEQAEILLKTVGPDTAVERLRVGKAPGFFLSGAPHALAYLARGGGYEELEPRRAGNTLAFERDGLVIRIEGERLTRVRALQIARSIAP